MDKLISIIQNEYQRDILQKLLSKHEYSQIYLADFVKCNDTKKNFIGTVVLLGTYNHSKKKREMYEVKIYKPGQKVSFYCSCPYHKFNSNKEGTVCKHICFLVCKVLKYYDQTFFQTKIMDPDTLNVLLDKLQESDVWKDKQLCKQLLKLSLNDFLVDDIKKEEQIVTCPTCENQMHSDCMNVWLERSNTCVYCRSDIWKHFEEVVNGETINITS